MILCDVNVLVYAHRRDSAGHAAYKRWLEEHLDGDAAFGVSHLVLSGLIRVVTNPRVFRVPTPMETVLLFIGGILERENCVIVAPGPRHWDIFTSFCRELDLKGNLVPDAYLAALAVESGCTWATTDGDYARFPSLSRVHPLHEHA